MKKYDWEDFRHFSALAKTLHLGRAAALLGTSQVTVMRRVKSLEHSLNATLFVRRRMGHRLTATGRTLLKLAQEAEQVLGEVSSAVESDDARNRGRVRIMTTEIGANWMLLPQVRKFRSDHPDIFLEIDASPHAQDLMLDTESLALRFSRPSAGDFAVQRVGTIPCSIYGHRDLGKEFAPSLPYVGWTGSFAEIGLAKWLRAVFAGHAPVLSATTFHGHLEAGRNAIGAVGLPTFIGRRFPELVEFRGFQPAFSLDAWLVVPSQSRRAGKMKSVSSFISRAVRESLK